MKKLYLSSSIDVTAGNIARDIGKNIERLKTVFMPTAAEPEKGDKKWLKSDRNGLVKAGFNLTDYTITDKSPKDIERDLSKFDVIHVNGGNTFYLLLQARKSGFDKWIRKVVLSGEKMYTSSSAGSLAAASDLKVVKIFQDEDIFEKLKTYEGFGLVDFVPFPHWGNNYFKSSYLNKRMEFAYKPENKLMLLNDWQYVRVEGDTYRIIDIRDSSGG